MRQAQRYMILFFIAAMVAAILLMPSVSGGLFAMHTPKGTVVIDAGHGGFDGGATGRVTGVREDGINLAVAKMLRSLFEKNGYEVIMTRGDENAVGIPRTRTWRGGGKSSRDPAQTL
jgi:N-acetylmuramoyl-L-alanine amidase